MTLSGIQAISSRQDVPGALRALASEFSRRLEAVASHVEGILKALIYLPQNFRKISDLYRFVLDSEHRLSDNAVVGTINRESGATK